VLLRNKKLHGTSSDLSKQTPLSYSCVSARKHLTTGASHSVRQPQLLFQPSPISDTLTSLHGRQGESAYTEEKGDT